MSLSVGGYRESAGFVSLFAAKLLRAPLWLLLSAVIARSLGPDSLGTWSMIMAAAMFMNQFFLHWTQSITQRYGRIEWLRSGAFDQTLSTRSLLLIPGLLLISVLLICNPCGWLQRSYGIHPDLRWLVLLALISLWLMAETQSLQQVKESYLRLAWAPISADLFLLLVAGLLLPILTSAYAGLASLFLISILVWLVWLAAEARELRWRLLRPPADDIRLALRFSIPLLPGFLVGYLAEWGDYFLIRHAYGAEREVGIFHPAYQYLLIMIGLPSALTSVLLPRVVAEHERDGGVFLARFMARHAPQLIAVWGIAALLAVALLPEIFRHLLGEQYLGSVNLLNILLIVVPGAIILHLHGMACFVQGRLMVSTTVFFGIKILVDVGLAWLLLPRFGLVAVAIGAVTSHIVLQWLFVLDQRRQLVLSGWKTEFLLLQLQLAALLLACVDDVWLRLLLAACLATLLLLDVRRHRLFAPDEIAAVIPSHLGWLRQACVRLFVLAD